jgi:anaerobic selenocysteine-containing dehydrogenase
MAQSLATDEVKVVKSICDRCHGQCGVLAYVKNGKVIKVEGDPDFPQNEGFMCPKGLAVTQVLHHPDRIKYPMKRTGKRGEGKWERISWDEALDTSAASSKRSWRSGVQSPSPGHGGTMPFTITGVCSNWHGCTPWAVRPISILMPIIVIIRQAYPTS